MHTKEEIRAYLFRKEDDGLTINEWLKISGQAAVGTPDLKVPNQADK